MTSAIMTRGLEVRYGTQVALAGVDLDVPEGSSLAVIGPNGSGKSTLLGAIAGTVAYSAGEVSVAGAGPALVLQSTDVDRTLTMTVRDVVALGRYASLGPFRRFRSADRVVVATVIDRLGIGDLARLQFHQLSGGQRQRVLVAQGLAQETGVLLLDEPITGLDMTSQEIIFEVIDEEVAAGKAVVVTTHSLDDARRCDQVLILNTTPIAIGTPNDTITEIHLRHAFGGRAIRVGNELLLDDPHHHHAH